MEKSPKLKFIIALAKMTGNKVLLGMDKIKYIKKNDIRNVSADLDNKFIGLNVKHLVLTNTKILKLLNE